MLAQNRFRQRCRLLRIGALVVFAGLCALQLLSLSVLVLGAWLRPGQIPAEQAWVMLVDALPVFGYLWALWAVQRALRDLAGGQLFQATVARAMRHMGLGVLIGALLNVFAVTNLSRWIAGGHGGYLYFDLSGIVLGVVGAALVLLSQLVDRARALQTELDEIF